LHQQHPRGEDARRPRGAAGVRCPARRRRPRLLRAARGDLRCPDTLTGTPPRRIFARPARVPIGMNTRISGMPATAATIRSAVPILALDVPNAAEAIALVDRLPRAEFVKVGLQLYTAEGPGIVRALRARERRIFLDLKFHDIPNTVAGAVASAARLGVDLLTVHAAGGEAMLRAASAAAASAAEELQLLAVTVLTS